MRMLKKVGHVVRNVHRKESVDVSVNAAWGQLRRGDMPASLSYRNSLLRLLLGLTALWYVPQAVRPLGTVAAFMQERRAAGEEQGGIGGMAYSEHELEEINIDGDAGLAEVVIPEPEEYSAPQPFLYSVYQIQKGDMIGALAQNFGLNQDTLVSINSIKNSRAIYPNDVLKIPNQDGIMYTVASGESVNSIAVKYEVEPAAITTANELFSPKANTGSKLFIPGAKMDYSQLQEINGDLFIWPIRGRITSRYGYRANPFGGGRSFHTGIDISAVTGVPIKAAVSGRVITAGYHGVFGNYVVLAHHSNYRTLYGHMHSIRAKNGAYVKTGEVIGYVGNTGQSTGSHLHFTVYKNGVTTNPMVLLH